MEKYITKIEAIDAVKKDGFNLKFCSKELRNDREVVLFAMENNGLAFKYVPISYKYDEAVVLTALQNTDIFDDEPDLISYFYDNEKVMHEAIVCDESRVRKLSSRLKHNKEFLLEAIRENPEIYKYVQKTFRRTVNKQFVLSVMEICGTNLEYVSKQCKDDLDIVLAAVKDEGDALSYASNRLRNNETVCLAAIKSNYLGYRYISDELKNSPEFFVKALKLSPKIMRYRTDYIQHLFETNEKFNKQTDEILAMHRKKTQTYCNVM